MKNCPACTTLSPSIGTLGNLVYHRCPACGLQFSHKVKAKNKKQAKKEARDLRQARLFKRQIREGE